MRENRLPVRAACRQGWWVHAYVRMGNHYHLLVETPGGNLVTGMKWLQGTFSSTFLQLSPGHLIGSEEDTRGNSFEIHLRIIFRPLFLPVRGFCLLQPIALTGNDPGLLGKSDPGEEGGGSSFLSRGSRRSGNVGLQMRNLEKVHAHEQLLGREKPLLPF